MGVEDPLATGRIVEVCPGAEESCHSRAGVVKKKVVIDPGHGGKDPGAVGPSGVREKDVALAIAKKLQKKLREELKLEAILHPLIRAQILAQVDNANINSTLASPYLLLVIPLLFETLSYHELVYRTLVVDCAETTQVARTIQRSGLDEQTVRAIMASQISRAERLRLADEVIQNDGNLDTLRQQVRQHHLHYKTISQELIEGI